MDPPADLNPHFTTERVRKRSSGTAQQLDVDDTLSSSMQSNLTKLVWDAGQQQVRRAFNIYANIDLFRPYFDVEPKKLRNHLILSLIPQKPSSMQKISSDLYGPTMVLFTLVALLLYIMKTSDYVVRDGTLIGAAFVTCFGYWFFVSVAVYTLCYVFLSNISLIQVFSVLGYALVGHCVVLALTAFIDVFSHSHTAFYILLAIFGGLSSLRLAAFFISRTPQKTHKLILSGCVCFLHVCFLLYLHFGYHQVVEEIAEILNDDAKENVIHVKTVSVLNQ